jgi:hypothetical protein
MGSNSYTIYPSTSSAFSTSFSPSFAKYYGVRGNKRKNFRDREKWNEELRKSISETSLDPPSGKLYYMDFKGW